MPPETVTRLYELSATTYIPHPASTKRSIIGPGTVRVTRWPDGGLDAKIVLKCRVIQGVPRDARNVLDV